MKRRLVARGGFLWPVLLGTVMLAGCGGDSEVTTVVPGGGPTVSGIVSLPTGASARLESSWLTRFASLVWSTAQAITGIEPAANVGVTATAITQGEIRDGDEVGGTGIGQTSTDAHGRYNLPLGDFSVDACESSGRVLVAVDGGVDLTRALAFSDADGDDVNVNAVSEAAVR